MSVDLSLWQKEFLKTEGVVEGVITYSGNDVIFSLQSPMLLHVLPIQEIFRMPKADIVEKFAATLKAKLASPELAQWMLKAHDAWLTEKLSHDTRWAKFSVPPLPIGGGEVATAAVAAPKLAHVEVLAASVEVPAVAAVADIPIVP